MKRLVLGKGSTLSVVPRSQAELLKIPRGLPSGRQPRFVKTSPEKIRSTLEEVFGK